MAETTTLLSIGEFSSLARLSVRMLRHYDAHGVLVPAQVDPVTGHRRYAPAQLEDAAHVRRLRDIGVGVSAIPALLDARGTPAWTRAASSSTTPSTPSTTSTCRSSSPCPPSPLA